VSVNNGTVDLSDADAAGIEEVKEDMLIVLKKWCCKK
jgi:hypothetical protein